MKTIEEINHLENCECSEVCTNCSVKHQFKPVELTGNQIADIVIENAVNPDHYNRFAIPLLNILKLIN